MPESGSPEGRRVLVAVVTGEAGERIQAWRERHDPAQARRLPPHATLCYWATPEPARLEAQVRHAFDEPVAVRLGPVLELGNREGTFALQVRSTEGLDRARRRLYDDAHATLPDRPTWRWHVTCVRDSRRRDLEALRRAAGELPPDLAWRIEEVAHLELRGERYEPLARWRVP